ncbi:hypothetical protein DI272_18925 [Streptomyces sp. Act143]|uniref:DUF6884 domain-containing protein n=1 Tax=Streptomyces sp. Act143 TaxID=2200760 RepID=UPI000D67D0D0|nr:DUF6884 domain-containing protein [Streptomyces sp. Act143]PWI16007.1 hypothetical protein DI272_18925 [Streptomyces sp. Act143]
MTATRLVVIPCAARKLDHPAPAGELYVGSYHRACRAAADRLIVDGGTLLILSDLHGFVRTTQVLQPYDTRPGDPDGVTVDRLREQAGELGVDQAEDVIVLAGRFYVGHCREVWPHALTPLIGVGMGIGRQLQRLAAIRDGRDPRHYV